MHVPAAVSDSRQLHCLIDLYNSMHDFILGLRENYRVHPVYCRVHHTLELQHCTMLADHAMVAHEGRAQKGTFGAV
jgi:hypothetical protein